MRRQTITAFLSILILFVLPLNAFCDEPTVLTLDRSIEIALENSLSLRSACEGVKQAEARRKEAGTGFLPALTAEYNIIRVDEAPSFEIPAVPSTTIEFTPKICDHEFINLKQVIDIEGTPAMELDAGERTSTNLTASLTQPLFTGFSLIKGYKIARKEVEGAKAREEAARQDLILRVHNAYFGVLRAGRLLDVAEEAVEMLEAHVRVAKEFFDVGMIPKNDLLMAEVELANIRHDLLRASNGAEMAEAAFNLTLRRDIDATVELEDVPNENREQVDLEACFRKALSKRPELEEVRGLVEQADLAVGLARSGFFPSLAVVGNLTREEGGFTGDREYWSVVGVATWTPWDWGATYYRMKAGKAERNRAELGAEELEDAILLDVKQAYLNLMEAEQRIDVSRKEVEQAEENFRITEEQYKANVTTSTQVLDARTMLSRARVNSFNALADLNLSRISLKRATGTLSGNH
ncbi:TolC family protein [Thermodesulfobacteriota bacterium]